MKVKIRFSSSKSGRAAEFGPYDWVRATAREIRVPVDLNVMDDDALSFKQSSEAAMIPFDNLLAVRQSGGTWELREMAGREAYEVYTSWRAIEI